MCHEDLPAVDYLCEWDGAVFAPAVDDGEIVGEDDKVVYFAFVEDLGGGGIGARHLEGGVIGLN